MTTMNPENTEAAESAGLAATAPPEGRERVRARLLAGWRFTRHLLEMVAAMVAGMGGFGPLTIRR